MKNKKVELSTKDILLKKIEAIKFLGITDGEFKNYHEFSKEIEGDFIKNRWYFDKNKLNNWRALKEQRTINLSVKEYKICFEFAIKMVYGGLSLNGIRGQRTEVQAADDVILGILAEHAIKKFLHNKFLVDIVLDESVHPSEITPQDFDQIKDGDIFRKPKIGVGVKASKTKNAFLILGSNEVELAGRKSDVYLFARVGLPSDHLFRILRDHSFFGKVRRFLDKNINFKKILKLDIIPIWICGFAYTHELEKVTGIPGQEFTNGHRYVKSVSKLHNSDSDWKELILKL